MLRRALFLATILCAANSLAQAAPITAAGQPAELSIRAAGKHSIRVTLKPVSFEKDFPQTPALFERNYPVPAIKLVDISEPKRASVGKFNVEVRPSPLAVVVRRADGSLVQELTFQEDGSLAFRKSGQPVLGMGEGGPQPAPGGNFRNATIQFDRNGAQHQMMPRWESGAYGSRNPVAMMVGTEGWGLFVATPWGEVDLREEGRGVFKPWSPPPRPAARGEGGANVANPPQNDSPPQVQEGAGAGQQPGQAAGQSENAQRGEGARRGERRGRGQQAANRGPSYTSLVQGRPPVDGIIPGALDLFVFDARNPADLMKDVSEITGPAVMPPKWSLGYMQSHRELKDDKLSSEELLVNVVDTFREKQIPVDAVIYLGTGFTPTGWNTRQPSFQFNPAVFKRDPKEVVKDLHDRNVKVIVHMVPPMRNEGLPTLQGNIPAKAGEPLDASHIQNYWQRHVELFNTPIDAWWPDEGDWFNLFERMTRHQMYYQGPLYTRPNVRPWSLHRNGHLGVSQWGGWVWSGDTQSTWKTLEGQIAVGINHSLSLSPFWGSDTGGFYTTNELSGELYARWFQFSAFNPSFRSHGRIWRLRAPWGWGLSDWGFNEDQRSLPSRDELNNPDIEPVCRQYALLRYQLMPYTYTLAAEARDTGMPFMRAMWLHYPQDEKGRGMGNQYLWGRDMLIAPVYTEFAETRDVYLPEGVWYDWWNNERKTGGATVTREVNLQTMPIYVRAGAVIPYDPPRQYLEEEVTEPTTIRIYTGASGQFRWYEDDGKSQEYLNGKFSWTNLKWDDSTRRLTIERDKSAGTLEAKPRKFVIQLLPENIVQRIDYNGEKATVPFWMH